MFYFATREKARAFAARTNRQVLDLSGQGLKHRWGVQVVVFQE